MEQSQSQSAIPGKICEVDTYSFVISDYIYSENKYKYQLIKSMDTKFDENNTYVTILNIRNEYNYVQKPILDLMESSPHIKIIYKSELAVNRRSGHGTKPRNMLVVWEYVKNPNEQSNTL